MNLIKASLLLVTCSACSGLLVIPEPKAPAIPCATSAVCGAGLVCDQTLGECITSPGGCSLTEPAGDCPIGRLCVSGNCLCADANVCPCPDPNRCPPATWCVCDPATAPVGTCNNDGTCTKACDASGLCVDITNPCSPAHPDGQCDNDEICVGGYCVPIDGNACSDDNPEGWCQTGFTCDQGRCVPIETPCTLSNPTGQCPSGEECKAPGQCEVIQCAPGKLGACPEDSFCPIGCTQAPCCEQLPCSPQHTGGKCDNAQYCSHAGICRDPDVCDLDTDCGANQYCGTTKACFDYGGCAVDDDCEIVQASVFGQGYECVIATVLPGSCSERLTCDVPTDCLPTKFCSSGGNCMVYPLCDGDLDCPASADPPEVCSKANAALVDGYDTTCAGRSPCHVCIDDGTCLGPEDCDASDTCSHGDPRICIPLGQCRVNTDCPPGRGCDLDAGHPTYQQCVVTGIACATNEFRYTGCAPTEFSCCESSSAVPPAVDCCGAGQICSCPSGHDCATASAENVCIPFGKCVVETDCLAGYFECVDYECLPTNPCAGCLASEICSTVGGCIPNDRCAADADCSLGERCNTNWHCEPVPECGLKAMSSGSSLPPNILVALDRSASMQICGAGASTAGCCGYCPTSLAPCGDCVAADKTTCDDEGYYFYFPSNTCVDGLGNDCHTGQQGETVTRWQQAIDAVRDVINAQAGQANFGLTLFPGPSPVTCTTAGAPRCDGAPSCTNGGTLTCVGTAPNFTPNCTAGTPYCTETCPTDCNWYSCSNRQGNATGSLDIAVGPGTASAIEDLLTASTTVPGGGTPTSQTLRAVVGALGSRVVCAGATPTCAAGRPACSGGGTLTCVGSNPTCPVSQSPTCSGLADPETQNAILLVTDGEALGDAAPQQQRVCTPPCGDGAKDGDETATDCGGSCGPCADTKGCKTDVDCQSSVCRLGVCRPATCGNDLTDGDETDKNCGGSCGPCADGAACLVAADCGSLRCGSGYCQAATCIDTVKNGGETDIDCGGVCATKCADGKHCQVDSDCLSTPTQHPCQDSICRIAACDNGSPDANETDTDCGGTDCGRCVDGALCNSGSDCQSNSCTGGGTKTCTRTQCSDGVKNGWETDVDCGTADQAFCMASGGAAACLGGTVGCTGGGTPTCRNAGNTADGWIPTCAAGTPTCGGGTGCGPCAGGKPCDSNDDCLSTSCGVCNQTEYACKVNAALDQLYAASPRVSTYVVAFNFANTSSNLNCHAAHGRTEKRDVCSGLTTSNCSTYTASQPCYYDTQNPDALKAALSKIVQTVRGCSFPLTSTPPSATRLYLYLQELADASHTKRVERYVSWDYDTVNNRIDVFGDACTEIKGGTVTPVVFFGCYCEEC